MILDRELTAGAFRIRDMRYPSGLTHPGHTHEAVQISIILRGELREEVASQGHRGCTGDVVVKPAGVTHSDAFDATRIICIDFDPREHELPCGRYTWHRADSAVAAGLRLSRQFVAGKELEEELDELLAALPDREFRDRPAAMRAAELLEESYQRPVRLRELARELRLHPVYLARIFAERWGCTPREYLMRLRVRAAASRITGTRLPLSEIAADGGFSDQAHMTRALVRRLGVAPAALRRLAG